MKKYRIYEMSIFIVLLFIATSIRAQEAQVFISEIMYDTPLNEKIAQGIDYSNGEYIKISNVYKRAVDLSGWTLSGGGKTEKLIIEQGTVIPSQSHIIFGYQHKDKNTQKLFTLDQLYAGLFSTEPRLQIVYQHKIILSNSGESIVLKDNTGLKRDSIYYDGTSNLNKIDRLEATNVNDTDGNKCFSLQRIQTTFDFNLCAETNNKHWIKSIINPRGFADFYELPDWDPEECTTSKDCNYVKVRQYSSQDGKQYLDEINYFDEMGQPIEKVQRQVTPKKEDLIHFLKYDNMNRLSTTWLPVATIGNGAFISGEQLTEKARFQYKDENPYTTNVYENSPLENIVTVCGVGQNWYQNQKFIHQDRLVNDDDIYHCAHFVATMEGVKQMGNYEPGQLSILRQENEDGHLTYEFHDKLQRLILSRKMCNNTTYDTYYVYDRLQNLVYVLPPLLVDSIGEELSDDEELMKQYAYIYKYDERNRCYKKRLPGCDWHVNVYDNADKLTFSQDGEQREKGICHFFFYDSLRRQVVDGYCKMPSSAEVDFVKKHSICVTPCYTHSIISTNVDTVLYNKYHYLLEGIQLNQLEAVSCNYYDNYELLNHIPNNKLMSYDENEKDFNTRWTWSEFSNIGLLTARIIGTFGKIASSYSILYYDYEKRPIQIKTVNEDGTNFQVEYKKYDFRGNQTEQLSKYWSSVAIVASGLQPEIKERYVNTYDHAGRIIESKHKLNDEKEVSLCRNEYDEFCRLKSKTLHNDPNLRIEFGYNIRSWLNNLQSTHFKQQLFYENKFEPFKSIQTPSFSGNISGLTWQIWRAENKIYQNFSRGYVYTYDDNSQLTSAQYVEGEYYAPDQAFFSTDYQYDKQGNITSLLRQSNEIAGSDNFTDIDDLKLNYKGNQLERVVDVSYINDHYSESEDFKDQANLPIEYKYNKNGSLVSDLNRGIANIKYNYLSLPKSIEFNTAKLAGSIEYEYSADGVKLSTIHNIDSIEGNSKVTVSQYIGNKIYEDGHLKRILFNGGYIENGKYYFFLTDYLGNNRVVVGPDSIIQQMHYYPFGVSYTESIGLEAQPYKFSGKACDKTAELNIYDFGARFYEADLGRFMTIDPKCETTYSLSPYHYCSNNPISRVDFNGMMDMDVDDWYKDKNGEIWFDPSVKGSKDLKPGEQYLGAAFDNDLGSFRDDGSILFKKEARAYERMVGHSRITKKENFAALTNQGVLMLPEHKNDATTVSLSDYGYLVQNGNIVDKYKTTFKIYGTVHTHPNGGAPSTWTGTGYGDLGFGTLTPNKPVYVFDMRNNDVKFLLAKDLKNYSIWSMNDDIMNTKKSMDFFVNGKSSLINFTKVNSRKFASY